ncbi:3-dehydroquinate synthase [Eubacterium ruminantium]|nr:3-dehydroquinate synthase [Eubacterium ruminantium]
MTAERLTINMNNVPVYDITYNDSFDNLKQFLEGYNADKKKCLIVSDSRVASHYMDAILRVMEGNCKYVTTYIFPEGEASKNLDVVRKIYEKLILEKFDRNDFIAALGGGVTGDMAGFTAATFLRGIDFIQIPTSLLADVDSSIGGKTGVDFDSYKNMVGAFHMPKHVYINTNTISTLDKAQFRSGMGEVTKSALLRDAEFFDWLEENSSRINSFEPEVIKEMIYKCNLIKKDVVEKDPTEKGERALLNLGHTLGHALEKYMEFKLLHGECVSAGTIMASFISFRKGLISQEDHEKIIKVLKLFGLPKVPADIDIERVISYTKNDKKVQDGKVKFILLRSIGEAFISKEVNDEDMAEAMRYYISLDT